MYLLASTHHASFCLLLLSSSSSLLYHGLFPRRLKHLQVFGNCASCAVCSCTGSYSICVHAFVHVRNHVCVSHCVRELRVYPLQNSTACDLCCHSWPLSMTKVRSDTWRYRSRHGAGYKAIKHTRRKNKTELSCPNSKLFAILNLKSSRFSINLPISKTMFDAHYTGFITVFRITPAWEVFQHNK